MNNADVSVIKFRQEAGLSPLLRLSPVRQSSQLHRSPRHVHTVLLPVPAMQLSAWFDQHDLWTTEITICQE